MTEFEELKPIYYKEKLNSMTSGVWPLYLKSFNKILWLLFLFKSFTFFAFWFGYRLCRKLKASMEKF